MLERLGKALRINELPQTVTDTAKVYFDVYGVYDHFQRKGITLEATTDKINSEFARKYPLRFLDHACIQAPVIEEIQDRLPSLLPLSKNNLLFIATSLRFAYRHCKNTDGSIDLTKTPYGQFAAGLHFSNMVRERNLLHAMVAHSAWNLIAFGHIQTNAVIEAIDKKISPKA